MSVAYVDTSALVAIAVDEPAGPAVAERLVTFSRRYSSNLLEAEVRATLARDGYRYDADLLSGITWVLPERALAAEISEVLDAGYLRGADLWHVATALHIADDPDRLTFITLDRRQAEVAAALGFQT